MQHSIQDIATLAKGKAVEDKCHAIELLYANFNEFDDNEYKIAKEIILHLSKDKETIIRKKLSEIFKKEPLFPHEVAVALANDGLDVAIPMLQFSTSIKDEEIIAILHYKYEIERQLSVASREIIGSKLTKFLYFLNDPEIIKTMVKNHGAELSELTLHRLLDDFPHDEEIILALTEKTALPIVIASRLIALAPLDAKKTMMGKYNIPAIILFKALRHTALADKIEIRDETQREEDAFDIIQNLKEEGKLKFSTIIGALCIGDLVFFETAIAILAEVPLANARRLIRDKGGMEARALYRATKLPESTYKAITIITKIAYEELDRGVIYIKEFQQKLLDKIMAEEYDKNIEQMPHFISILEKNLKQNRKK